MRLAVILFVLASAIPCLSETPSRAQRDDALAHINNCLKRSAPGHRWSWRDDRACRDNKRNVQVLVDVYRGGDKSVLPTLLHFTYLTDFYGESLLADPDGFLAAMSGLPEENQRAVAEGLAGGMMWIRNREQFERLRKALKSLPESSPNASAAQLCLKKLEANNAAYLANYFPPQTFTTQAKDFRNQWYSRTLYSLGELPLWPPESTSLAAYRITVIPAFFGPTTVTLQVLPDGTGRLTLKKLDWKTQSLEVQKSLPVAQDDVEKFLNRLNRADYWRMPAESSFLGHDGAEWILEGVHNGEYHLVARWCPDIDPQSQEMAFAEAARGLFKLAGQKL